MNHLMIDLETLGTFFNAPVIAIGAVFFDPETGLLGDEFEALIDFESAMQFGKPSGATIKWWFGQNDEARRRVTSGQESLPDALRRFESFAYGRRVFPWGNGASFDISILEYAYSRALGRNPPWQFYNVRDCRTIKELAYGIVDHTAPRKGTHHSALDDAIYQAEWVSTYWRGLRGMPADGTASVVDDLIV